MDYYITCSPKTKIIESILNSVYDGYISNIRNTRDDIYFHVYDDNSACWDNKVSDYYKPTEMTILDFLAKRHKFLVGKDFRPGHFYKCVDPKCTGSLNYFNSICVCIMKTENETISRLLRGGYDPQISRYFSSTDWKFIELTSEELLKELES